MEISPLKKFKQVSNVKVDPTYYFFKKAANEKRQMGHNQIKYPKQKGG